MVVEREGGCIAWGGAVRLSPADDVLIRVERALDIDSEGQLVASVLSKKVAAGSTHVLIDLPVGTTAKVRSPDAADRLGALLVDVGRTVGLEVRAFHTDGTQPVGRGIGPALERRLNRHGIRRLEQLAGLSEQELIEITEKLAIAPNLAQRDRWIDQARELVGAGAKIA